MDRFSRYDIAPHDTIFWQCRSVFCCGNISTLINLWPFSTRHDTTENFTLRCRCWNRWYWKNQRTNGDLAPRRLNRFQSGFYFKSWHFSTHVFFAIQNSFSFFFAPEVTAWHLQKCYGRFYFHIEPTTDFSFSSHYYVFNL